MSWKSAPAGRRNRLPHLLSQTLDQQGGAGGFACRPKGDNPWSCIEISEFPKTCKHPCSGFDRFGDEIGDRRLLEPSGSGGLAIEQTVCRYERMAGRTV